MTEFTPTEKENLRRQFEADNTDMTLSEWVNRFKDKESEVARKVEVMNRTSTVLGTVLAVAAMVTSVALVAAIGIVVWKFLAWAINL